MWAVAVRTIALVVLAWALFLGTAHAGRSAAASGDVVKVKLRDCVFHIPERNAMGGRAPFWPRWIPGLDDGSSAIGFTVPHEQVSRAIPGFRSKLDFFALLTVLTDEEVARYRDPRWQYGEMWYGTGSYAGRRIEPLGETGWYRLYHPLETKSWEVFRQYPDANRPLPDDPLSFYVARCSIRLGGKTTDCLTYALSGRIAIDFSTEEENLLLVDELRGFFVSRVLEWKQPD